MPTIDSRLLQSSRCRRLVAAIIAVAFAFLVSVAASHLHRAGDHANGCVVCAAFAGKLEAPGAIDPSPAAVLVAFVWPEPAPAPRHAGLLAVTLPPSCGPAGIA
jgi:hypothetical protein